MIKINEVLQNFTYLSSSLTSPILLLQNEWWWPRFKAMTVFTIIDCKLLLLLSPVLCIRNILSCVCLILLSTHLRFSWIHSSPLVSSPATAVYIHLSFSELLMHQQIKLLSLKFLLKSYLFIHCYQEITNYDLKH